MHRTGHEQAHINTHRHTLFSFSLDFCHYFTSSRTDKDSGREISWLEENVKYEEMYFRGANTLVKVSLSSGVILTFFMIVDD